MKDRFFLLVRHFFLQFFQVDTGNGEARPAIWAVLGILTVPGTLMSMVLFGKYSSLLRWIRRDFHFDPYLAALPDKYTFLAFSIAVTGIVAVLRWDTLFPDRRDFANLAPLPIDLRVILASKVVALAGFVLVFVVDINLVSTVLFPFIVMEDHGTVAEMSRFLWAHAVAMIAAGLWTFCAFLAFTGTLMSVLPYRIYAGTRRYIQFGCTLALLMLFFSASAVGTYMDKLTGNVPAYLWYLPPAWFLGLYQQVQGKAPGAFPGLAHAGTEALLIAFVLALLAYGVSYRRFFLRSAESGEAPVFAFPVPKWLFRLLDRIPVFSSVDRGALRFTLLTLARSDRHAGMLAATLAPGAALAVQSATDAHDGQPIPPGILAATLIVIYTLLTGLRLSFGVPVNPAANWAFRVNANESASPKSVVRSVMILFVIPVVLVSTAIYAVEFGLPLAFEHLLFSVSVAAALIAALSRGFAVIPFTCSWLPGGDNLVFAVAVWGAGLLLFGHGLGALEAFLMLAPWRFVVFWALLFGGLYGTRRLEEGTESLAWADTRSSLDLLRIAE